MRIRIVFAVVGGAFLFDFRRPWCVWRSALNIGADLEECRQWRRAVCTWRRGRRRRRERRIAWRATLAAARTARGFPDSGEIGLPVGRSRNGAGHIGLAI